MTGAVFFEIDVPATGDGVHRMLTDDRWDGDEEERNAVFSPYRTLCGGDAGDRPCLGRGATRGRGVRR